MTIGQHINLARLKKELSVRALAEKAFVSQSTIASWIYHGTHPDIELLIAVADVLEISLDELVGREFPKEAPESYVRPKSN